MKYDRASIRYCNVFIEYMGYSKPSGIAIRQATFYIITDGKNYYLIETLKLKELCNIHRTIKPTRNKTTQGYIINKNIVIANSKIIYLLYFSSYPIKRNYVFETDEVDGCPSTSS